MIGQNPEYAARHDAPEPSLDGKKVLFVYGGWEGHEPRESRDLFVPWLRSEGATVTDSASPDAYLDEQLMGSVDLIIHNITMGSITSEQLQMLLKTVRNGAGIAGWHGGLGDSLRDRTEYQFMVGGQFVSHPGGIIDYTVNLVDHDDPITRGLTDFNIRSEQYYMQVDPNVNILATTEFSGEHASWIGGCVMPVVWKRYHGNGRVFYSALGHTMSDFDIPEVMEIQRRGIRWASESKYHPFEKWIHPVYKNHKS